MVIKGACLKKALLLKQVTCKAVVLHCVLLLFYCSVLHCVLLLFYCSVLHCVLLLFYCSVKFVPKCLVT